jgi:hypothetical protein
VQVGAAGIVVVSMLVISKYFVSHRNVPISAMNLDLCKGAFLAGKQFNE